MCMQNFRLRFLVLIAIVFTVMGGKLLAEETPKLVVTSHQDGAKLKVGVPATFYGKHSLSKNESLVFCFLRDAYGFYFQPPSIEFIGDDTWEGRNIRPGKGIDAVTFCEVNQEGAKRLKVWEMQGRTEMIKRDEIEKVSGYRELARVRVIVE